MLDKDVINGIKNGGRLKKEATQFLIDSHQGLMHQIKQKHQAKDEQIKDIYADAISDLIWNIQSGKFIGKSKISSYLYRIIFNKSVDLLRKSSTNRDIRIHEIDETNQKDYLSLEIRPDVQLDAANVKAEILKLGDLCKNIIMDWAYWGYDMKSIAIRNNLQNADRAKKQKYGCLQKLRKALKHKGYQ